LPICFSERALTTTKTWIGRDDDGRQVEMGLVVVVIRNGFQLVKVGRRRN
jgi:hypothetical protein